MEGTPKIRQTISRLAKLKIVYISGCLQSCVPPRGAAETRKWPLFEKSGAKTFVRGACGAGTSTAQPVSIKR
jgi:hypothetical protein